jgi:hypothetical protein
MLWGIASAARHRAAASEVERGGRAEPAQETRHSAKRAPAGSPPALRFHARLFTAM